MPSQVVAVPSVQPGEDLKGNPALLLSVGPTGWPVMIAPEDFDLVTRTTGFTRWGVQRGQVVVGDDDPRAGRLVVARILLGFDSRDGNLLPAFRDGNPLNLVRTNLGITSRAARRTWWLILKPGEVDKVFDVRGCTNNVPDAIKRHRPLVPEPRPKRSFGPFPARTWHRSRPLKVAAMEGTIPDYVPAKTPHIIGLDWGRRHEPKRRR